jgi:hypothetical protein
VTTNQELQKFFSKKLVKRFRDWDAIVGSYLRARRDPCEPDSWKDEAESYLKRKRYKKIIISGYMETVEKYADFVERFSFLYSSPDEASRSR